jgi:hypothetical protein
MKRRGIAMTVLLALLALLIPASGQAKVPRSFWGVSLTSGDVSKTDVGRMARGGVGEVHWTLYWPAIEPSPGMFDWGQSDALIGKLASKRIRLMPAVYGSPGYAAGTPQTPPLDSTTARMEWSQFIQALVNRYGPGGDYWTNPTLYPMQHPNHRAVPIKAWQIWNEPNVNQYFNAKPPVSKYATLLRISHDAVKAADSRAKVILAGMPGYTPVRGPKFLNHLYAHHIKPYFDAAAVHPYAPTVRLQERTLKQMRKVMGHHGDRRTPLWITEMSWGSAHPDKYGLNKGLRGQKRNLVKSFKMILRHRNRWRIGRLFWFQWRDLPKNTPPGYCNSSLCHSAGLIRANGKAKPAWGAYRRFARR